MGCLYHIPPVKVRESRGRGGRKSVSFVHILRLPVYCLYGVPEGVNKCVSASIYL